MVHIKSKYKLKKLSSILIDETDNRIHNVCDDDEIINPTIKTKNHTISVSNVEKGKNVKVKKRVNIMPGDLVFSRLHTQNGSFAFSEQNFISTTTFIPFSFNPDETDKNYLFWALHLMVPHLKTSDTVGRETFKTKQILDLEIPHPKKSEQIIISKRINNFLTELQNVKDYFDSIDQLIDDYWKSILFEAFSGNLTKEWRSKNKEKTASEDLSEIFERRKQRFEKIKRQSKKKSLKKPDNLKEIDFDKNDLYSIPPSWVWCSANSLCERITDGEHNQPKPVEKGIPILTARNIRDGYISFEKVNYISEHDYRHCLKRCDPAQNDILIASTGTIGRVSLVGEKTKFALTRNVLFLKPEKSIFEYLYNFLHSSFAYNKMTGGSGFTGQQHLYIGDTKILPIPFAPLEEQEIILDIIKNQKPIVQNLKEIINSEKSKLNMIEKIFLDYTFQEN